MFDTVVVMKKGRKKDTQAARYEADSSPEDTNSIRGRGRNFRRPLEQGHQATKRTDVTIEIGLL